MRTINAQTYDEWMRKIGSIHYSNNEAMCNAYEKVEQHNNGRNNKQNGINKSSRTSPKPEYRLIGQK